MEDATFCTKSLLLRRLLAKFLENPPISFDSFCKCFPLISQSSHDILYRKYFLFISKYAEKIHESFLMLLKRHEIDKKLLDLEVFEKAKSFIDTETVNVLDVDIEPSYDIEKIKLAMLLDAKQSIFMNLSDFLGKQLPSDSSSVEMKNKNIDCIEDSQRSSIESLQIDLFNVENILKKLEVIPEFKESSVGSHVLSSSKSNPFCNLVNE